MGSGQPWRLPAQKHKHLEGIEQVEIMKHAEVNVSDALQEGTASLHVVQKNHRRAVRMSEFGEATGQECKE